MIIFVLIQKPRIIIIILLTDQPEMIVSNALATKNQVAFAW